MTTGTDRHNRTDSGSRQVTCAVLLAAGRGKRLRPYTDTTPKPLLPVNGQPTLDLYFTALAAAGVSQAILVTHHLRKQIEAYASEVLNRFGIQCSTVHQSVLDGTASALQAVFDEQGEVLQRSPFILMATDYLILPEFIKEFLQFHASHDAGVSISLKHVPQAELASRSSVRFDARDYITEIVEKPARGKAPSDFAANLAFVLSPAVCSAVPGVKPSVRGEREIQSAINAHLSEGGTAKGLLQDTPDEWAPSET